MPKSRTSDAWDAAARHALGRIISPVEESTSSPLRAALEAIPRRRHKIVADLGCGTGPLLPELSRSFSQVVAIDHSRVMLAHARERLSGLPGGSPTNVLLERRSLAGLARDGLRFDVALTINSLLMPDPALARRVLRGVAASLRPGGIYLGVFLALESIQEEYRHSYWKAYRKLRSRPRARATARSKLGASRIDFALGVYETPYMAQKYYTQSELGALLEQAHLSRLRFDRVVYARDRSFNLEDRDLRGHPRPFHWFVRAQKRS